MDTVQDDDWLWNGLRVKMGINTSDGRQGVHGIIFCEEDPNTGKVCPLEEPNACRRVACFRRAGPVLCMLNGECHSHGQKP